MQFRALGEGVAWTELRGNPLEPNPERFWRSAFGALIKELVEAGKYKPVIDRTYSLDEIVEAVRYVESGQKTGNVVLRVSEAPVPEQPEAAAKQEPVR